MSKKEENKKKWASEKLPKLVAEYKKAEQAYEKFRAETEQDTRVLNPFETEDEAETENKLWVKICNLQTEIVTLKRIQKGEVEEEWINKILSCDSVSIGRVKLDPDDYDKEFIEEHKNDLEFTFEFDYLYGLTDEEAEILMDVDTGELGDILSGYLTKKLFTGKLRKSLERDEELMTEALNEKPKMVKSKNE